MEVNATRSVAVDELELPTLDAIVAVSLVVMHGLTLHTARILDITELAMTLTGAITYLDRKVQPFAEALYCMIPANCVTPRDIPAANLAVATLLVKSAVERLVCGCASRGDPTANLRVEQVLPHRRVSSFETPRRGSA